MIHRHTLSVISNVGLISQALYAYTAPVYDERQASEWQAKQVSFISVFNCAGRIIIGMFTIRGSKSQLYEREYESKY